MSETPTCAYCDATTGLRVAGTDCNGRSDDFICADCFTGTDTGPCFDDLPLAPAETPLSNDNAWDRIGTDPRLANALRKLSIHEIRLIIVHAQARHDAALKAILAEPYGCPFCDSGALRNPDKNHDTTCGFFMAQQLIADGSQP